MTTITISGFTFNIMPEKDVQAFTYLAENGFLECDDCDEASQVCIANGDCAGIVVLCHACHTKRQKEGE